MPEKNCNKPAIIFDFGKVLIDWDPYYLYRHFLGKDPAATDRFLKQVDFAVWNRENDRGRPLAQGVKELSARFPEYRDLITAYDTRYLETIQGPILPVVAILKKLKAASYPLYGLSNWPAEKFAPLREEYSFFELFDEIVISSDLKLIKPDPAIYQVLLLKINKPAEECIFIDDSEVNTRAAEKLGLRTIVFRSASQLKADLSALGVDVSDQH